MYSKRRAMRKVPRGRWTGRMPWTSTTPLATVLLAIVDRARLLPLMFTRALKAAEPSLGIMFLQGSAAAGPCLLSRIRLDRRPGLGLIFGRYGMGMFLLVVRHVLLL